ncbi:Do family serine endopeptidase [Ideonella livida]|uniref:Probable periplasmic serine endoprotease DegP-like n=1 Tax=Ideonella livida TaxID=2707176 RepID=A0A7C9TIL0_9BURK|nr:Do family serine endopeptidase [Ideonella livida]NDY91320.1 Do family serine endopeptidase [Ideonella livida]
MKFFSKQSNTLATVAVTAGLTTALVAAGSAGAFSLLGGQDEAPAAATAVAQAAQQATTPAPVPPLPPGAVPDYRSIVKQNGPTVVGVMVAGTRQAEGGEADVENDPFYQFFRGMPGFQQRQRGGAAPKVPFRGQGSGFIIASDGLILTNAHVVRDAKEVTVRLQDHREFAAKVLGADPVTDIAVLRIDAKGLPAVRLGDTRNLEVGDPVLAIGAPYGLEQTATQGIVSAKGRSLPGDTVVPFIQTDAAVNPGNSGGPLFDGTGAVVGINAQIYSQSGGFQGLSFAIPINVALKIKDQIVATGQARHGQLGVMVQDVNQALAESFGMKRPEGALIAKVAKGSAAEKAGLKAGDVIVAVNGERVPQAGALSATIGLATPGEKVSLQVWRDGAEQTVAATLGGADNRTETASAAGAEDGPRLGLSMRPLSREEQRALGGESGLIVDEVGGAAARAGIEPGDVVTAINGKPVKSVEDIRAVLKNKPKQVALLVRRQGDTLFVPVPLG